jgi:hypothetical protein
MCASAPLKLSSKALAMSATSVSPGLIGSTSAALNVKIWDSLKLTASPGATCRCRGVTPYTSPMKEPSGCRFIDFTTTPPSAV